MPGVVAGATRDAAVDVPGPLPVGRGERVVGRLRRQRQHDPVEQGARLVGGRTHERRGLRQHGVELVERNRAGPGRPSTERTGRGATAGGRRPPPRPGAPRRTSIRSRVRRRGRGRGQPATGMLGAVGDASKKLALAPVMRCRFRLPKATSCGWARSASSRVLGLPALEETEGVGRFEVLAPEVLEATGVTPAGLGHLGQAGQDVIAIRGVETEGAGDDDHPGRVAASSGGGERTEVVPYERSALEDRQQPGLVL